MPRITTIPATKNIHSTLPISVIDKRKVAGYARVSTDSDEQFTSYEAQIDYYTKYIKARDDWQFTSVYTDEGISATSTKNRAGFNRMIKDALAGKIDLIVTKSVSRFARNTVDSLVTIRKLKEQGVECYFEKENIYTFDGKGELLLTIMSSLAQEESRSISENVTWGQRKRFADGKVSMPYKQFLGYRKGEDGLPEIVEEEAEVVRLIYKLFLDGRTPAGICKKLEKLDIPTPSGNNKWSQSTVVSILSNEKYKGDALLQKKFTVDFLSKKMKANEGEVPQYYVEGSHKAIVEPLDWERVQVETARRKKLGRTYSGSSVFSSKLLCGDCGGYYGSKVWHSNDKYRSVVWLCNRKYVDGDKCKTPRLKQEIIQGKFLQAYNQFMENRDGVIADCELLRTMVSDCAEIDVEISKLEQEIEIVTELVKKCVNDNALTVQSQEEYQKRYDGLVKRYEKAVSKHNSLLTERATRIDRSRGLHIFIESIKIQPLLIDAWDDYLWTSLVESGTVMQDGSVVFKFVNGTEISI